MKNFIFLILLFICSKSIAQISITGDQYHLYGPNTNWGEYLQVGGNGRVTEYASVVATNGNLHLDAKSGGFATFLNYYSQNPTLINVEGGNVGVGLWNPQAKLDVNGKSIFRNNQKIFATDEAWGEGLVIVKPSGWSGIRITRNDPIIGNFEGNWALGYSGATGNDFSISNHYNNSQNDYLFHISAANLNVGIGTSAPQAKLHINSKNNGTGSSNWIAGNFGGLAGDRVVMGILGGTASIGAHNNALNAWANLSINPDGGNVGIGTTDTKGYKLAIAGNMIAEEVKVKLQGNWPDYVFNDDYQLIPLAEIQSYIKANKHLPEVPSAKEMEKNGINLSEMNMLLLKKVEELTLHLIETKKALDAQSMLNVNLEKRLQKIENQIK